MRHQQVADVMTTDVVTVGPDAGFKEIAAVMSGRGVTALPVVDDTRRVLGILTESDLLRKVEYAESGDVAPLFERRAHREARHKAEAVTAAQLMTAPAYTIASDAKLISAARMMSRFNLRRLPVVDSPGTLAGIVSRGDLISVYTRPDELIAADLRGQVLHDAMMIDADSVQVHVRDGVAAVSGQVERRSLVPMLIELARAVDGVVDVEADLTYRTDDTATSFVPSPYIA